MPKQTTLAQSNIITKLEERIKDKQEKFKTRKG